jgi:hypothetical protein
MTNRQFSKRFAWTAALGIVGVSAGIAAAASEATAASAFMTAAEKFGVFAAMSLTLTGLPECMPTIWESKNQRYWQCGIPAGA